MSSVAGRVLEFFRVLGEARHIMPALKFKMPDHQEQISIVSVFEDVVAQHPDRLMLLFEGREWTYQAFNADVNRLAHGLAANGVTRGDTVALFRDKARRTTYSRYGGTYFRKRLSRRCRYGRLLNASI